MNTDIITGTKQWVCVRWDCFGDYYYVGPFTNVDQTSDWADENQGGDIRWELRRLDPNVPLEVRAPGAMPELHPDPKLSDRWTERQSDIGDFYLLMIGSDPLHLVGPFSEHRQAFSWATDYQLRTDDEGWQVLWLDDPAAPVRLLMPAEGVVEQTRRDAKWRREWLAAGGRNFWEDAG